MYFSEIQNLGKNCENSCLWAHIDHANYGTNPIKCGIIL